jgi:hypothetical protein
MRGPADLSHHIPEEETMNRIKEHLEQRELPLMIRAVLENTKTEPMPLVMSDGTPMTMVGCVFGLGALVGSYIACEEIGPSPADVREAVIFLDQFQTPEELRDAIWGPQD